jgi:hypothetical protein
MKTTTFPDGIKVEFRPVQAIEDVRLVVWGDGSVGFADENATPAPGQSIITIPGALIESWIRGEGEKASDCSSDIPPAAWDKIAHALSEATGGSTWFTEREGSEYDAAAAAIGELEKHRRAFLSWKDCLLAAMREHDPNFKTGVCASLLGDVLTSIRTLAERAKEPTWREAVWVGNVGDPEPNHRWAVRMYRFGCKTLDLATDGTWIVGISYFPTESAAREALAKAKFPGAK